MNNKRHLPRAITECICIESYMHKVKSVCVKMASLLYNLWILLLIGKYYKLFIYYVILSCRCHLRGIVYLVKPKQFTPHSLYICNVTASKRFFFFSTNLAFRKWNQIKISSYLK